VSPRIEALPREDAAYAEACGRGRVLEGRLIGPADLEELLALGDPAELGAELARRGTIEPAGRALPEGWEEALDRAGASADRILLGLDPRPAVSRLLVLRHDLSNLRGLLRARAVGVEYDGPWHPRGTIDRAALEGSLERPTPGALPEPLAAEARALARTAASRDLRWIDDRLDTAWLGALRAEVRASGSRFFLDWLGHHADLANVRALVRHFSAPGAWPGPPALLPGGHLDSRALAGHDGVEGLFRALARTVYAPLLERAARVAPGAPGPALDREADDFLTELLRPVRRLPLGPEPLWAWHLARDVEAKNVRALMLGALAGLPAARVRPRLRRPYA